MSCSTAFASPFCVLIIGSPLAAIDSNTAAAFALKKLIGLIEDGPLAFTPHSG